MDLDDYNAMKDMWTAPDVATFMDDFGPRTADEVAAILPQWVDVNVKDKDVYLCHFERVEDRKVIGYLGWGPSNKPIGEVDFAYVVRPGFRSQGFATEALTVMVDYCFGEGIASVWGACHHDNVPSARVMEKAGMTLIGRDETELHFIIRR